MKLRIVCSGHLVRYPLGGHSWHHLQYLIGFKQLGHQVTFFEDYGWKDSCYDPSRNVMTSDPSYGIAYLEKLLKPHGLDRSWCYLSEDGRSYGMARERLAKLCRESDIYFNLSNINWIPELGECRRRALVGTDPVYTQIRAHGLGGPFSRYDVLFTYGENVHRPRCEMPTAGARWVATRQPVVFHLWAGSPGDRSAPFTTVMNWSSIGDQRYEERIYGQKERQFEPFFSLPREIGVTMELAVRVPNEIRQRLIAGGWRIVDPVAVTRDPRSYQQYLRSSKAEFSVARHGYVTTRCGWFSDRSTGYLASGRPVVIEDTGFSDWLATGAGVIAFKSPDDAKAGIDKIDRRYEWHCRAAREVAEEYFDARKVLSRMIDCVMNSAPSKVSIEAAPGTVQAEDHGGSDIGRGRLPLLPLRAQETASPIPAAPCVESAETLQRRTKTHG